MREMFSFLKKVVSDFRKISLAADVVIENNVHL